VVAWSGGVDLVADEGTPVVAILEDDAMLGDLAAELCGNLGLRPVMFATPGPFLDAIRDSPPAVLVLDWRLQDQVGAAAFMAVRHRHPELPVVCWTASPAWRLPQMIRDDPMTQVVDKAAGAIAFEAAMRRALDVEDPDAFPEGVGDVRPVPHPA
jgi:DNA-binding NtrC family response regulator